MAGRGCPTTSAAAFARLGRDRARGRTRSSPPTRPTPGRHVVIVHRHGVGQVAGLPAAGAAPRSEPPAGPRGERGATRPLPRADQGARPGPARPALRVARASTCASPPTTATPRREQRDWTRDHGEYVLTNPDMLHRSLLPGHAPLGAVPRLAALRRGRRVPPLPRRLRRPRRPDPAPAAAGLRAVRRPPDVRARLGHRRRAGGRRRPARPGSTSWRSPTTARRAARSALALWEPPFTLVRRRERRARTPLRVVARSPTCSPTWWSRASAPSRSSGPGAAPRGRADRGRRCSARSTRRCRPGGGLPRRLPARGAPRARGGAARAASCSAWPPPTPSSSASTSAGSTRC